MTAKALLRSSLRARRRSLAAAAPDAASRAAVIAPLAQWGAVAVCAGYNTQGSEFDPGPLMARLAAAGAALALPAGTDLGGPLTFRAWRAGDPLVADVFGVASPRPDAPALHPDLVIVPVLGFDRRGGRIGQGGGTYDRTLANLRGRGPVFALGLAYAGQEVDEIPQEAHDQRLDAVLTESDYFQFGD